MCPSGQEHARRDVVVVTDEDGVTDINISNAYHTGSERFVTLFGVLNSDPTLLAYQVGTPSLNKPVKTAHYSWFARSK